jgi:hypothetical protein
MTRDEILLLKACKSDYSNSMRNLFGKNWKNLSRKHRIYNVPSDSNLVKEIKEQLTKVS